MFGIRISDFPTSRAPGKAVSQRRDPENWSTVFGGDGGYCAVDQTTNPYFYGEYIYLQIFRVVNGEAQCIDSGIGDAPPTHDCRQQTGGNADFIAPFILDPNNPARILAGGKSLWRSNNVRVTDPSAVAWAAIKQPVASGEKISAIAVAPGNSDIIWVGYDNGSVYFTTNGTASAPTWTQRSNALLSARRCTRITIGNASQLVASNDPQGSRPITPPSAVSNRTTSGKHKTTEEPGHPSTTICPQRPSTPWSYRRLIRTSFMSERKWVFMPVRTAG